MIPAIRDSASSTSCALSRANVAWNDLVPALAAHIEKWTSPSTTDAMVVVGSLRRYLEASAPPGCSVLLLETCGEVRSHITVKWEGYILPSSCVVEIANNAYQDADYDRLIGRLEQMDRRAKRVVVLTGETLDEFETKLRRRYARAPLDRLAIVRARNSQHQSGGQMLTNDQLPDFLREVIDEECDIYDSRPTIQIVNEIPDTSRIPIQDPRHWLQIPNVICVAVDMKGSTTLSAAEHPKGTARAYRLFTGTMTRLFHELEAPYIDVQGDGVFALFDADKPHLALAAAVTCKTFASEVFLPKLKERPGLELGCRIGIDRNLLLVRKIGLKRHDGRTDRQNEVWAGRTVNMACKLASLSADGDLVVSSRYYDALRDDRALKSCGCPGGQKVDLWSEMSVADDRRFDFDVAMVLHSQWCPTHGKQFCQDLIELDR